jgi:hypothetical protein
MALNIFGIDRSWDHSARNNRRFLEWFECPDYTRAGINSNWDRCRAWIMIAKVVEEKASRPLGSASDLGRFQPVRRYVVPGRSKGKHP